MNDSPKGTKPMYRTTGGPAFPRSGVKDGYGKVVGDTHGMSLRDYAIIQFTAAMLANPQPYEPRTKDQEKHWPFAMVSEAADLADAMLLTRK
jgi:hypothetical protein